MINLNSVVIGNGDVGKTSLLLTYFTGSFPGPYIETRADDIVVETSEMKIHFWDTGGGESYSGLRSIWYRGADIFILCFSLTKLKSFLELHDIWYPEVSHFCPNTPIILVGTQLDLRSDEQSAGNTNPIITTEEGQKMAEDIGAVRYFECSSVTQKGVRDIFDFAISIGMNNKKSVHKSCSTS